ncbi:hypothetical protein D3C87_1641750 [compost metagenome]
MHAPLSHLLTVFSRFECKISAAAVRSDISDFGMNGVEPVCLVLKLRISPANGPRIDHALLLLGEHGPEIVAAFIKFPANVCVAFQNREILHLPVGLRPFVRPRAPAP